MDRDTPHMTRGAICNPEMSDAPQTPAARNPRGAWTAAVYYNQILWQMPDDDKRNVRLFTGWAVSDGDASFGKWSERAFAGNR